MAKPKEKMIMVVMLLLVVISFYFLWQGMAMHSAVDVEEAKFHALQEDYFGGNDKATRDVAPANSELSGKLVELQQYPSELLRLKLVGVGKLLTGIFILLLGILMALVMMPVRLGAIIKKR